MLVLGLSIELVIASRAVFMLGMLIWLNSMTTVELVELMPVVDVQRMANRSVNLFKIDAKNLAVSQLAMSVAGEV